MGITFSAIRRMDELGLFGRGGVSILDIGSSNLYSAKSEEITGFLTKYQASPIPGTDEFAARLAEGSGFDSVLGGRNEAFVGELFERAGMRYKSFDIAAGYKTTIFDLNNAVLPRRLRGTFDLVLNFGTTEHVLNQLNSFRVMHDATRVDGYMYHQVPAVGYVDHGYVTYTGRCLFDLAGFNDYDITSCWFDGPSGGTNIFASLESYKGHFPALGKLLEQLAETEQGRSLRDLLVPDISINVVYRKVKNRSFIGALEISTSVGEVSKDVVSMYSSAERERSAPAPTLKERVADALRDYPTMYMGAQRAYRTLAKFRGRK